MTKLLGELFDELGKNKSVINKKKWLVKNMTMDLLQAIQLAYHPNIRFDLPPGTPPIEKKNPGPEGMTYQNLNANTMKKLEYFLKGAGYNLTVAKKQSMFADLWENLHDIDAIILVEIKDKKLSAITEKQAFDVFPELFSINDYVSRYPAMFDGIKKRIENEI